jgi:hypothetical protein
LAIFGHFLQTHLVTLAPSENLRRRCLTHSHSRPQWRTHLLHSLDTHGPVNQPPTGAAIFVLPISDWGRDFCSTNLRLGLRFLFYQSPTGAAIIVLPNSNWGRDFCSTNLRLGDAIVVLPIINWDCLFLPNSDWGPRFLFYQPPTGATIFVLTISDLILQGRPT